MVAGAFVGTESHILGQSSVALATAVGPLADSRAAWPIRLQAKLGLIRKTIELDAGNIA
jgi:hypothetical protein